MHTRNSVSSTDNEGCASSATDVSIASVEQLRSLTASKLRLHLKRCPLPTSGNKLTMATQLHQYFCTSVNTTSVNSGDVANSDNAEVPPRDAGSQNNNQQKLVYHEIVRFHSNSPISCSTFTSVYATCKQSTSQCQWRN